MPLVIESIYDVLVSRLDAIESTTVNEAVIEEIEEPLTDGSESPRHGQIVIGWGDCERVPDLDVPGNPPGIAYRQTFNLDLHVRQESSTIPSRLLATKYVSAVVGAMGSAASWYSFGGYALNAEFLDWTPKENQGQLGGITLPLAITYRTAETDMTVQR
jgi:hypothetical protein